MMNYYGRNLVINISSKSFFKNSFIGLHRKQLRSFKVLANRKNVNSSVLASLVFTTCSVLFTGYYVAQRDCECSDNIEQKSDKTSTLPIYRRSEIAQHNCIKSGIWVTHRDMVYDITKFIANHPGGSEKIMLAAGQSVDKFWHIYQQHYNSKLVMDKMEDLLIGKLHSDDVINENLAMTKSLENDIYATDPEISPVQIIHQQKPINSETPSIFLTDSWVTPEEFWFVRNHHPVPLVDPNEFVLNISGIGIHSNEKSIKYTLDDIKTKFKKYTITSTIQW